MLGILEGYISEGQKQAINLQKSVKQFKKELNRHLKVELSLHDFVEMMFFCEFNIERFAIQ